MRLNTSPDHAAGYVLEHNKNAGLTRNETIVLAALFAAAFALRLWPVIIQPSMDWGDEIYQAAEPAHRLVFGRGLVTWEWVAGIRSWLISSVIAAVMEVSRLFGGTPAVYLTLSAGLFAALGVVPVWAAWRIARARFGAVPALAAACVPAFAPELVFLGARPLAEVVAGHLLCAALLCFPQLTGGVRQRPAWLGAVLGLSFALRPQVLPAALVLGFWPGAGPWRPRLAGFGAVILATALLDWVTLGAPAASIWRYALVNLGGASSAFGTQPALYYLALQLGLWGPLLLLPVALCVFGARRVPVAALAGLAVAAAHLAIGHKEQRFLYPAFTLFAVTAGVGLAELCARAGRRPWACPLFAGGWILACALVWQGPAMTALRHRAHDELRAADYASRIGNVCGIGMGPGKTAWVPYGGYTHLHQNVPLFWPDTADAFRHKQAAFNVLLSIQPEPGYAALHCFGDVCVSRRSGDCAAAPPDAMPPRP